ncbi:LamG-like jellyroll fold domain-containing protein [Fulvitalea axinellae]
MVLAFGESASATKEVRIRSDSTYMERVDAFDTVRHVRYGQGDVSGGKLSYLNISEGDFSVEKISKIWEKCGYPPTYIVWGRGQEALAESLCDSLNALERIRGKIEKSDGTPINGVRLSDEGRALPSSYFSVPVREGRTDRINFRKPGYEFNPEVVKVLPGKKLTDPLLVLATQVPLYEGIVSFSLSSSRFDGVFPKGMRNRFEKKGLVKGADYWTFNGKGAQVRLKEKVDGPVSIYFGFRFKEEGHSGQTLFRRGEVFEIFVRKGILSVDLPGKGRGGVFSCKVEPDVWNDLVLTVETGGTLGVYLNGEHKGTVDFGVQGSVRESLVLGRGYWNGGFRGDVRDVILWTRTLGSEEISELSDIEGGGVYWRRGVPIVGILAFLFIFLILFRQRKVKKVEERISIDKRRPTGPEIRFFGGFKVINRAGNDCSHDFAPQVRELLALFFLHTANGQKVGHSIVNNALWCGLDEAQAKNRRSTLFTKLRKVLTKHSLGKLEFDDGSWRLSLKSDVECDIPLVYDWMESPRRNLDLETQAIEYMERGTLCRGVIGAWLASFISEFERRLVIKFKEMETYADISEYQAMAKVSEQTLPADIIGLRYRLRVFLETGEGSWERLSHEYEKRYKREKGVVSERDLDAVMKVEKLLWEKKLGLSRKKSEGTSRP